MSVPWRAGSARSTITVKHFVRYTEHDEFRPLDEYVHLMHRAFRIRPEIVEKAIQHLTDHGLEPYAYNAMHVRRNDFQYKDIRHAPIEKIYEKVRVYIKGEPLLIISDEYNAELVELMERSASRVVMWKCEGRCPPDQLAIDMLAAVPAKRFFGSPLSTFSGGIAQWRNRCRPHSLVQHTVEYTYDIDRLPIWGRPGETRTIAALGSPFHDIGSVDTVTYSFKSWVRSLTMTCITDTKRCGRTSRCRRFWRSFTRTIDLRGWMSTSQVT